MALATAADSTVAGQTARWTDDGAAAAAIAAAAAAASPAAPSVGAAELRGGAAEAELLLAPCDTTLLLFSARPEPPDRRNATMELWLWLPLLRLTIDETRWGDLHAAFRHSLPQAGGQRTELDRCCATQPHLRAPASRQSRRCLNWCNVSLNWCA